MSFGADRNAEKAKSSAAVASARLAAAPSTAPFLPVEMRAASLVDSLRRLWSDRRFIAKAGVAGALVGLVVAFAIPSRYDSTTRLMPPDSQSGGSAALAMLTAKGGEGVGALASNFLDFKGTGPLFIGVLQSRTVQDRLVQRFDLHRVYRVKLQNDAREELAQNTSISEDRKSGVISLTVTDKSPERSAAMAQAYVEELDKLTAELNTSAAHRERVFLEDRLKNVKSELDSASKELSEFSSKNRTLDISEQGKAMVSAAASLEGELMATEAQLGELKQIYTDSNFRVRSLQGRAAELRRQLGKMVGNTVSEETGPGPGQDTGSSPNKDLMVSIRNLPQLGLTYYDLFRRIKIQEAVFETLTKQYELAKVEEAKEIPVVRVLDPANVPERKSRPHRFTIILAGAMLGSVFCSVYLLASMRWQALETENPTRVLALEFKDGLVEDFRFIRNRIPKIKGSSNGASAGEEHLPSD
ncbi:MAG: GumC family protein [Terriglobales bacterium]